MREKEVYEGMMVREDGMVKNLSSHFNSKKGWHTGSISNGYRIVGVRGKGKQRVHRLVAEAFIPNPENKPMVNHINGVKNDNRVSNLEWCTSSENIQHAYDTGLQVKKLILEDCTEIKNHLSEGKLSQRKIAELYGVAQRTITNINRGIHWSCK